MNRQREDGMWAIDLSDATETKDAIKELFQLEIGTEYKDNYYTSETGDEDFDKIIQAVHMLYSDGDVTVQRMAAALKLLIASGEIRPTDEVEEPLEAPVVDDRPRTKNGALMNESQLRYREYREWSEQASAAEVNLRRRSDPGYASYVSKAMQEEMRSTPVADGAENLNANRVPQKSGVPSDVLSFATRYRTMSVADAKKMLSPGMNPDGPAAAAEANRLFAAACADGLV